MKATEASQFLNVSQTLLSEALPIIC
jgi:hypothetical protein